VGGINDSAFAFAISGPKKEAPLRNRQPAVMIPAAPLIALLRPNFATMSVTRKQDKTFENKNISMIEAAECPGYAASNVDGEAATAKQIQSDKSARTDKYPS
jgi:hypothetical protein